MPLFCRVIQLLVHVCTMESWSQTPEEPAVKIVVTARKPSSTTVHINKYLGPGNTVITKKVISRFQDSSLEPFIFKILNIIKLSRPKYSVTSCIDFFSV